MVKEEIICAGFGGQGIMLLGKFIAFGAMRKGLNVTWMPSYGAEVRGGTAYSMVTISDDEIASPIVYLCDTLIAMNKPSFDKYISKTKQGGIIILNSSLADGNTERDDISVVEVAITDIAYKLGNVKIANTVALGAYMKHKKFLSRDAIIEGMGIAFPQDKKLIELNIKALEEGLRAG